MTYTLTVQNPNRQKLLWKYYKKTKKNIQYKIRGLIKIPSLQRRPGAVTPLNAGLV